MEFSGYLFDDTGTRIQSATVKLLQVSDGGTEASTTTDSNGLWSFSSVAEDRYDVEISVTSGSKRRIKWADEISLKALDVRNNDGNGVAAATFTNLTNNPSNKVASFRGANSTRANGDEVYISFELANSNGDIEEFARITAEAVDVADGGEDGQLRFGVAKADGTITDVFTINSTTGGVTDMTLDVSGDLTLDADGGDVFFKDNGTTFGSATNNSGELIIKSGTTTALTFSGANVAVAGDLTITGDDLVMNTNTDGFILVANGTNYSPVGVSGDVTIANDGAVTIASTAVESGMLNNNVISGQTEITSGLAAADELLYSDGGTIKKVGLDNFIELAPTLATEDAIANGDYILFLDGGATGNMNKEAVADFATLLAGTGLTASSSVIGVDTSQAITALTGGDLTIYEDANNADVSLKMGTSASESLTIEVLNGGSNKTAEEIHFSTATASSTADHGKMVFDIDGTDILEINDGGISIAASAAYEVNGTAILSDSSGTLTLSNVDALDATTESTIESAIDTLSNLTTTGALNSGSITSGFGGIDNGTSGIRTNTFTAETSVVPDAASGATLGTEDLEWGHLYIGDDQKIYLGDGQDVSLEYDEDGTDQLRVSGATVFEDNMEIADSKFIEFASAAGTPATDNTAQGIVIEFLAAEAITQWDAVYVSSTTGRVGRANATAAGTMPAIGVAIEAQGSAGSSVRVLTHGIYRDDGGFGGNLTPGAEVYAPESDGNLTATRPSDDGDFVQVMGVAVGVRSVFINPSLTLVEHA